MRSQILRQPRNGNNGRSKNKDKSDGDIISHVQGCTGETYDCKCSNLKNKRSCPYLKTRECSTAEQHGSLNRESGKAMQNPYQSSSKSLWVLLVPTTANSVNGPVVESLIPNANLYVVGRQHAAAAAAAGAGAGGRRRRRITSTKLSSRKNNNHLNEENIRRCFLAAQKTNDFVAPVLI